MVTKIVAVVALLLLPVSAMLWHTSHSNPAQWRLDLTLHKSLNMYLREGVCTLHILSMPSPTAVRSEFRSSLFRNPTPGSRTFMLSSITSGLYRRTWLAFPLWLSTGLAVFFCLLPVWQGPVRRFYRVYTGKCVECGYDLTGNRSGRCPECGWRSLRDGRRGSGR